MRYLLALLVLVLTASDVGGWTLSLAPGLSVKNGMIYLILLALAARFVVRGGMRMELPRIHLWFGILLTYATLTWLAAGILIQYKTFDLLSSGFNLKTQLFENAIVFVLFLYGTRTLQDAEFQLKCLLLAVATANAIAIGNVTGIFDIGVTVVGIRQPRWPGIRRIGPRERNRRSDCVPVTGVYRSSFLRRPRRPAPGRWRP